MAEKPSIEELEKDAMQLTTVWYGQSEAAYLMHVNDLSVKIDRDLPQNIELKRRLDLYIKMSEQMQRDVKALQNPSPSQAEKQQKAELKKQIDELDKKMEELQSKAQKISIERFGNTCQSKQLFEFICKQGEEYNHVIEELGGLMEGQQSIKLQQIKTDLLEGQHFNKQNEIAKVVGENRKILTQIYKKKKPYCDDLQKKKNNLINKITGFFKDQSSTFTDASGTVNIKQREATLNIIKEKESKLIQIERQIAEKKSHYDSKLMGIIELKNLILLKEKQQEENISQGQEKDSLDNVSVNQSYGSSQADSPNLKFVIQKQSTSKYLRIGLAVWLVALLVLPFTLFSQ